LPVVDQYLDGRARTVAKDEQGAIERVVLQAVFAGSCQSIYARTKVNRLNCHQNTHVRGDRNHLAPQNVLHSGPKLARPAPLSCTRIFAPYAFSNSSTHSNADVGALAPLGASGVGARSSLEAAGSGVAGDALDMMTSTNSVSSPGRPAAPPAARSRRCIKPASATRSTPATRWGVCSWHICTASPHSAAGMRSPRTRDWRQCLN